MFRQSLEGWRQDLQRCRHPGEGPLQEASGQGAWTRIPPERLLVKRQSHQWAFSLGPPLPGEACVCPLSSILQELEGAEPGGKKGLHHPRLMHTFPSLGLKCIAKARNPHLVFLYFFICFTVIFILLDCYFQIRKVKHACSSSSPWKSITTSTCCQPFPGPSGPPQNRSLTNPDTLTQFYEHLHRQGLLIPWHCLKISSELNSLQFCFIFKIIYTIAREVEHIFKSYK